MEHKDDIKNLIKEVQERCEKLECKLLIAIHNKENIMWVDGDINMRALVVATIDRLTEYSDADKILALQIIIKELSNLINYKL